MPGDNQLSGARVVGLSTRLNGKVGRKDLEDLIQFSTQGRSSLNLSLSKISKKARAGVELYKLTRPLSEVTDSVGSIDFRQMTADERGNFQLISRSRGRSNRAASIRLDALDGGDYVVRIVPVGKRDSKYRLSMVGALLPEDPTPAPTPDPTPDPSPSPVPASEGNSFESAIPLTFPVAGRSGTVSDSDTVDYYSFALTAAGDYKVSLSDLSANATIEVFDSNRNVVKSQVLKPKPTVAGAQDESLILALDSGSYFARVSQNGGTTSYGLNLSGLTDAYTEVYADNSFANAVDITSQLSPTEKSFTNYVLDGSKALDANGKVTGSEDFFKFKITQRGFFTLKLEGVNGGNLDGNLDVQLFSRDDFANPGDGLLSAKSGKNAEIFGGILAKPGSAPGEMYLELSDPTNPSSTPVPGRTYYLRIAPGAGASGEGLQGSEYKMTVSLKDRSGEPTATRDIRFGDQGSQAAFLTEVGNLAYFSAVEEGETALWVSDGTLDGTRKLKAFKNDGLSQFTKAGSFLYFMGNDGVSGDELWRSNGTTAGTVLVQDLAPGATSSTPLKLTALGDRVYFEASPSGDPTDKQFFRTKNPTVPDPQGINIEAVLGTNGSSTFTLGALNNLTALNGKLYFSSRGNTDDFELWSVDNTTANAVKTNLNPGNSSNPSDFFFANGKLYGVANTTSDPFGVPEVVQMSPTVTSVSGGAGLDSPSNFVVDGTIVYFAASNGIEGNEVRKLDTASNTISLVADSSPGADSGDSNNLVVVNNTLYFFANNGTETKLWKSTGGSGASALTITDAATGAIGGSLFDAPDQVDLVAIGTKLYFTATDTNQTTNKGRELWEYDTVGGTFKMFDINTSGSSDPKKLGQIGDLLFFIADNGQDGEEVMSL
jgi:ELWxxDGT repeat protein